MKTNRLAASTFGITLVALSACSDPMTGPSSTTPVLTAPSFALAAAWPATTPIGTATPETGAVSVCLAAGGTNATFTASKQGRAGDVTTGSAVPASFSLTPGNCTTIWGKGGEGNDSPFGDNPVTVTINLTSGNLAAPGSVFSFAAGDACDNIAPAPAAAQGGGTATVVVCANNFHGTLVTFTTSAPPPPPSTGCTFTKGWYRNHGSATVIGVDGRTAADARAIFDATPAKPGGVTFGGDNSLLNLYQQLLAALNNLGGDANALNGPPALDAAITAALAGTGESAGFPLSITTTLNQTQISDLTNVLSNFNEGNVAGWPHCDD